MVDAEFTIQDGSALNTQARKYARDFIFAAYATHLPIKGAQIVITEPNGKPGLAAYLGSNVAAGQPTSTWTDSSIGPTVFVQWMQRIAVGHSMTLDESGAAIGGEWAQ